VQPPPSLTIPADPAAEKSRSDAYGWYVVGVLMFTLAVAYVDRQILSLLVGPIKLHFGVSDTHIGLLAGFAFALFYTLLGVPIARLSDRYNRILIISIGVIVWTFMTVACGLANSFAMLFLARVGVGIGEAALGPAAYSVIADYFPPEKVARAIGVYVAGLYLGVGFAMIGGSIVVQSVGEVGTRALPLLGELHGWQIAFVIAAVPGVVAVALLATVREPARRHFAADGSGRSAAAGAAGWRELWMFLRANRRFFVCLTLGASFVGTVIMAYLVWTPEMMRRTHDIPIAEAGFLFGVLLLVFGGPGPYAGGWLAAWLARRGYRDAEMRACVIGCCAILIFSVLAPLAPTATLAWASIGPLLFVLAVPQGLAPAMLQLATPNRMRARATALFTLVAVLIGASAGPALVAVLTDFWFRDPRMLGKALAVVSGVLMPLGILFFWMGLAPYARARIGFTGGKPT
jgi:MFS family permease